MNDGRYEQIRVEDRWNTVLPDGTIWASNTVGLEDSIASERKHREWFTVMYAELLLNGVSDANPPPAPAREIVHVRTITTTITVIETLDRHEIDHSKAIT